MYHITKTLAIAISKLSPGAVDRLARGLAFMVFDLLRIRRALVLHNLKIAFGNEKRHEERLRIGRTSVYHVMLTFIELLRSVRVDIHGKTTCRGLEHIQAVLKEGKGAYFLAGHLGNWEAMGSAGTRFLGTPAWSIVKKIKQPGVNRFVEEIRHGNGLYTIHRDPPGQALRAIRDTLRKNQTVGFMLDQARPGAPRIPFFGTPAKTQTSLAAIWRKHPAPVVPISIRRTGVERHEIRVRPPLPLQRTGDSKKDTHENTALFNRVLEEMIRECPDQYFWMHDRWKE